MERTDWQQQYRNSWDIPVNLFRLILFVPFAIERRPVAHRLLSSGEDLVNTLIEQLDRKESKWHEQNLLLHLEERSGTAPQERLGAYDEFVYFQPYVQRFLYSTGPRIGPPPVRLYQRNDIAALDLTLPADKAPENQHTLPVDRVNLYLFDSGNVILAVELFWERSAEKAGDPFNLAEAMRITHLVRRVFPPFLLSEWEKQAQRTPAMPTSLAWTDRDGRRIASSNGAPEQEKDYVAHVNSEKSSPLHRVWRELLAPLAIEGYDKAQDVVLSQCGDDRAPYMLLLGVDNPSSIADSDWYRLCFTDKPGPACQYPVARPYAQGFEKNHCYDRYWQPGHESYITRYLFSDMACTLVLSHKECIQRDSRTLEKHFRRHYFQLGLINHYHRVALITLSERLANAVNEAVTDIDRFREHTRSIQRDALRFTNRYWFTEITAQPQGQHLFQLWRRHLRTEELYDQLTRELEATNAFLAKEEDAETAKSVHHLTMIGAPGIFLAVIAGFFGMNYFDSKTLSLEWTVAGILIVCLLYGLGYRLVDRWLKASGTHRDLPSLFVGWAFVMAAVASVLIAAASG